ncbi:MAG: hypothetical protein FD155_505 [Bacteroidetes bacterium]|nr:MAG: hypothetical protein FD155_505 [Bacteroidota bacterium]
MKHLLLFLLILCSASYLFAQEKVPVHDSVNYRKIEEYSEKRKLTELMYKLIFIDTEIQPTKSPSIVKKEKESFESFEGKTIREIHVIVHDPFEYHSGDNTINPENLLLKAGNSLHIRTLKSTIKNLLLFESNESFDSLRFEESERLVRSQKYLRQVLFTSVPVADEPNAVDVIIRVWDNWSLIPQLDLSTSNVRIQLKDNNFVGTGHQFKTDFNWNLSGKPNRTQFEYFVPSISNSYITAKLHYSFEGSRNLQQSIDISRQLYSPLAKWAGGIYLGRTYITQRALVVDTIKELESRIHLQDYWGAKSWKLLSGNTVNARTTNLILSSRLQKTAYPERTAEAELAHVFNNQTTFLVGLGITSRKFVKDRFVFDYGKIEDIPIGRAFGITVGMDVQQTKRAYAGVKMGWGNYAPFGYFSTSIEYGTFFTSSATEQGTIRAGISYFTPLLERGKWKFRPFFKSEFIIGIDRLPTDILTFTEGMKAFKAFDYKGNHMMAFTLQLQTYAPYNVVGFRFGPFMFATFGMLGNDRSGFRHSRLLPVLGAGLLIKNEYLIIQNFQISLSYFPYLPGSGNNIFKVSSYETSDFGVIDFELSKPGLVVY